MFAHLFLNLVNNHLFTCYFVNHMLYICTLLSLQINQFKNDWFMEVKSNSILYCMYF